MTVAELIAFLQTQPQHLQVAYQIHSEQCLLEVTDIETVEACEPRADGWIQHKRPDMPTQTYLMFPGKLTMNTTPRADAPGYWCLYCNSFLPEIDGVVIHENVPHPDDCRFDEEDYPQ
jgi:hypothetical protein